MVGVARFELTTPASRRQCSTRLSYTPNRGAAYSQFFSRAQRASCTSSSIGRSDRLWRYNLRASSAIGCYFHRINPLHPAQHAVI